MAWLAFFALVLWLPVVFTIFEKYPVRKAIVFSFVTAWLFLPPTLIPLPGFPDWSKMTATVTSVTICVWLKQPQRIFALKFRWYDLPVLVFCFCPFVSSIVNGAGAYDGLSAVLDEVFRWGLPYLIGRAFLADAEGVRQLCLGIAVGGIIYVPLCLFELRMSPILNLTIYGFNGRGGMDFGMRYGGYRPMVFLSFGLELGWWMCCASLASYQLWASGSVKRLFGYPMSVLTMILGLVTIACKATGALVLIAVGFVVIMFSKRTKTSVLLWALIPLAPFYCVARPLGIMSGEQPVSIATSLFGGDRAQSLQFRFEQEEILMRNAMYRPIFGWSRNGGFNPVSADGKSIITDGLWIIVFGASGYVGLASLNAMLLVPSILFLRRFPPKTWQDPDVAPVATFAMILPLFMIDNLSNAMLNPIYAIAMGLVSGYEPSDRKARRGQGRSSSIAGRRPDGLTLRSSDQAIGDGEDHAAAADRFEADAVDADEHELIAEADESFRGAIERRRAAVDEWKTSVRLDQLAKSHALYARFLSKIDRAEFAIVERERALAIWRSLEEDGESGELSRELHAANLNDLAWLLIAETDPDPSRLDRAIVLSEEAVQLAPRLASFWNTLGIARYRNRDYYKAIHALSRSVGLNEDGGNAFDFYYLALANHALGYSKPAADWFDRAESWTRRHPEMASLVRSARTEALASFSEFGAKHSLIKP